MAYVNKGETRRVQGLWDDAIVCTRIASILDPGHGVALSNLIMYKQNVCDWRGIAGHFASLTRLLAENDVTHTSSGEDPTPTVSPYQVCCVIYPPHQAVTFPFSPAHTLSLLNTYAQDILSKVERIRPLVRLTPPPQVSGDRYGLIAPAHAPAPAMAMISGCDGVDDHVSTLAGAHVEDHRCCIHAMMTMTMTIHIVPLRLQ
jgi:hypothetical protein